MTVLVTLKSMADQQSAWGSSLKVVLVVVECMRQYTENSPGCSTAKNTNVRGRRQYITQSWKPLLARWTVTDHISTVTGHIGTQTTVCLLRKINLYHSLCNNLHTLSVLLFFLPKKPEPIHFLEPCEVQTVLETSFRWLPQVWTQTFLRVYFRRTCFVHTPSPRTTWQTSHKANYFSRATLCATCENCVTKLHYFRLPQSRL